MVVQEMFNLFATGMSNIFSRVASFSRASGFSLIAFAVGGILVRLLIWAVGLDDRFGGGNSAGK